MSDGFAYFNWWATSLVTLKYTSWSIAHGMRHGILDIRSFEPKICGKEVANEEAAWIAAKWT